MKHSGIIRRFDDLGRIVIPKDIRRQLRIKEGAPYEILCQDGSLLLIPYASTTFVKNEITKIRDHLAEDIDLDGSVKNSILEKLDEIDNIMRGQQ